MSQFIVDGDCRGHVFRLGTNRLPLGIVCITGDDEPSLRIGLFLPDGLSKAVFQRPRQHNSLGQGRGQDAFFG